jgi:nuclear cap-binding protein subunit 2
LRYFKREHVLEAVQYLNGTKIDNRKIHVAIDFGFYEGRQYGRGKSGGAKREEIQKETSESKRKRETEEFESSKRFK